MYHAHAKDMSFQFMEMDHAPQNAAMAFWWVLNSVMIAT